MRERFLALTSLILSLISLATMIYALSYYNPVSSYRVTYDYLLWISTILLLYASYLEIKCYTSKPLVSTAFLVLLGGFEVVLGRLLSLYYNSLSSFGYVGSLVGEYYTIEGFKTSLLVVSGALIIVLGSLTHLIFGRHIVIAESPSLADIHFTTMRIIRSLYRRLDAIFSARLVIVSIIVFVLAFVFRLAPEIYWWPYLIGWDTPEYVAHLMDFKEKLNPFTSYHWMGVERNIPPLLDILLTPFAHVFGSWNVFKVYPSVAFGVMAALSTVATVKIYGQRWFVGFLAGLISTLSILNLRISWDYQRQLLGSLFMLGSLVALEVWSSRITFRRAIVITLLLVAMSLSHEVTGFVAVVLSAALLYRGFRERSSQAMFSGSIGLLSSVVLEIWYWRAPYSYIPQVGYAPPGLAVSGEAYQVVSYLTAGFGLIIFPMLVALARYRRVYVSTALLALLLAGVSPVIASATSVVVWYRFLIGVAPITSTLAAVGVVVAIRDWRYVLAYLLLLSLPGLSFVYAYNWSGMFTRALREFPPTLTPTPAYMDVYDFFKNNSGLRDTIIIAHPEIARYIHLAIRNPENSKLIWINGLTSETLCKIAESTNTTKIIIVARLLGDNAIKNATCVESYEPVNERYSWILFVRVNRHETNTNTTQPES